jgi:2-polyprenyl-3-methyl-5-hydroxy-6-metoxy-1,4-benzoquinol methylase
MGREILVHDISEIHVRETVFHDGWASSTPVADVRVRECFEAPTALENQFVLREMGPLAGKRLLDIGAGLGESSVYFALQGAKVTMIDISPQMIAKACEVGRYYGVELEGRAAIGERLPVSDNTFDVVYIANTIHHVKEREQLFGEIRRVLKPGGRFFSIDPIAYNPAINVYRRMANQVRTEDESPLTRDDLRLVRSFFSDVHCRMFWMTALALFAKYFLVDRIHPNQDRYWKRILTESKISLWWWYPLRAIDSLLTRLPGARWWSWNIVVWGRKEV